MNSRDAGNNSYDGLADNSFRIRGENVSSLVNNSPAVKFEFECLSIAWFIFFCRQFPRCLLNGL